MEQPYSWQREGRCCPCPKPGVGSCLTEPGWTKRTLWLDQGYYRHTPHTADVRPCYKKESCVGRNRTGESLCSTGYRGVLCGSCDNRFYVDSITHRCVGCEDEQSYGWGFAVVAGSMALLAYPLWKLKTWAKNELERRGRSLDLLRDNLTTWFFAW